MDKKPSDLDHIEPVEEVFETIGGISKYSWFCPNCGEEHDHMRDIPFNIRIICSNNLCKERMVIRDDVEILFGGVKLSPNEEINISPKLINGEWVVYDD